MAYFLLSKEAAEFGPSAPNLAPKKCVTRNSRTIQVNAEVHHLAGTLHLDSDLPAGVTDTLENVSLLLFVPQEKGTENFQHHKAHQDIHLCIISLHLSNGVRAL